MNKLEIKTNSDGSGSNAETCDKEKTTNNEKIKESKTSRNDEEEILNSSVDGKDSTLKKSNIASNENNVTSNYYETAEDIQKILESPKPDDQENATMLPDDTLRDKTYTQTLAPTLQDVLNDFVTESDDSDKEPKMEIVEDSNKSIDDGNESKFPQDDDSSNMAITDIAKNAKGLSAEFVEEVLLSEIQDSGIQALKSKSINLKKTQKANIENKSNTKTQDTIVIDSEKEKETINAESKNDTIEVEEHQDINSNKDKTNNIKAPEKEKVLDQHHKKQSQNSSGDTLIPNNQECLSKNSLSNQNEKSPEHREEEEEHILNVSRKRTSSEETLVLEQKKRKNENSTKFDEILQDVATHNKNEQNGLDKDRAKINEIKKKENVIANKSKPSNNKANPGYENPCLKSVNLFADQFNNLESDDSETSGAINNTINKVGSNDEFENIQTAILKKDVIVLQSHSETESHTEKTPKKDRKIGRLQRKKALANVFGFSSGTVTSSRKTKLSLKKSSPHQKYNETGSRTSDWTSESETEVFVSPPRARRNRQTKKYLKPKSARILSLEEEGGLFVMYGKKIYPLVKDGKMVKNYLTYKPNSESEFEDEKYWKQKYAEEKKKTEELKKLLEESKKGESDPILSPILPAPRNTIRPSNIGSTSHKEVQVKESAHEEQDENKTMKIKLTRNNEEVYLEGRWPQIQTVLKQVVSIIDTKTHEDNAQNNILKVPEQSTVITSGESTPVAFDPVTHEKVDKIESEIFKEIEERDKEEQPKETVASKTSEDNVTKRGRGRPRKSSSISTHSVPKKPRTSITSEERTPTKKSESDSKKPITDNERKSLKEPAVSPRKNKSPKKSNNESSNDEEAVGVRTTRSSIGKLRRSGNTSKTDESNIRYMLPTKKATKRITASNTNKTTRKSNRR